MNVRNMLENVFGGGGTVAPSGTGAILTRPSKLSVDVVNEVVKAMPLDGLYKDLGVVAANVLADSLESRSLRPADYAALSDLSDVVAKRVVKHLVESEVFSRAFSDQMAARG